MIQPDNISDVDLLRAHLEHKEGDAFAELVLRHISWIYHLARRQLTDPADAEDATQAVFILLLRKAGTFSGNQPLAPWLYKSAMLICRDIRKQRQRRAIHEQKAAAMRSSISDSPDDSDMAVQLDAAITHLRKSDRETILLRYYQEISYEQIASMSGISEDAAKMRLNRAVKKLRAVLTPAAPLSAISLEQILTPAHSPLPNQFINRIVASTRELNQASIPLHYSSWHLLAYSKIATSIVLGIVLIGAASLYVHSAIGGTAPKTAPVPTTAHTSVATAPVPMYYVYGNVKSPGAYEIWRPSSSICLAILDARGPDKPVDANTVVWLIRETPEHTFEEWVYRYQALMTPLPNNPDVFPLDRKINKEDRIWINNPKSSGPIAPGDLLLIAVADSDQPSQAVDLRRTVSAAGDVQLPQAGAIHLIGKTMLQAEKMVRDAYAKANLIDSPLVSVGRIKSATDK